MVSARGEDEGAGLVYAVPLKAIDQVVDGSLHGICTVKAITVNEPFFAGHYPNFPIFPGSFILEAVHQATCRYVTEFLHVRTRVQLTRLRSVRFLSPLYPGDLLRVACQCTVSSGGELRVKAECWRQADPMIRVAHAEMEYVLRAHDRRA